MGRFIVGLGSRAALRPSVAGSKGAGLARLRRAGFAVPPGFVITTAVFRGALTAAVRRMVTGAGPPDLENLEAVRDSFLSWDILPAHRKAILRAYAKLGGAVAVRSSMVGEDSVKASFAGRLDTVLDVSGGEEVIAAVRKCLASALGARLWSYLYSQNRAPEERMSMAVVVQSMVKALASGVAFSEDPAACSEVIVIEAVPGPGAGFAGGREAPERHRIDPRGELEVVSAPAPAPARCVLDEPSVRKLGAAVRALSEKLGVPHDVEWAFDGRDFAILQARPATAAGARRVYSRRPVADLAPGMVKPLIWSTNFESVVKDAVAPLFEEILGRTGVDYSRLIATFHSRVYADVTFLHELLSRAGLPPDLFDALAGEESAAEGRFRLRFRARMLPVLFRTGRYALKRFRGGRRIRRFLDSRHVLLEAYRAFDWDGASSEVLLEQLGALTGLHGLSQWQMVRVATDTALRSRLIERLVRKWAPGTNPQDVLKGFGRRGAIEPYEGLARLAADARDVDPRLLARIAGNARMEVREELAASEEGRQLIVHFDIFMRRYGFLAAGGVDFSEAPWTENPRLIWKAVARVALAHPSTLWDGAEARRRQALDRVKARLNPIRDLALGRLLDAEDRLAAWRERIGLLMTEEAYLMRRCVLALGSRLVARNVLGEAADIFYLYEDELKRILADPREASRASELVGARRAELTADAAEAAPETICGGEETAAPEPEPAAGERGGPAYLSGIGASHGISTGRARIVRDPFLAAERPGEADVLVVPSADAGWLPFLCGAGGIVSETGGELCDAAVIARELGVPAVVGVGSAISRIREGQAVTVDGTAGRVYHRLP